MKKLIITTGTVFSIACSSVVAFADSDDVRIPQAPQYSVVMHTEEKVESSFNERMYRYMSTSTALTRMKAQGDRLIKERLNALEANKTAIQASKLTDTQKNAISAQIATTATGLTALRSSIASSTDASSTKALVNSVYTQFRVYAIAIPQVRLEKRVYELQNHADTLASSTFAKVQTKIDEAKTKGKDVTVWQKSLDDAKVLVAKDVVTLSSLLAQAQALSPATYGTSTKSTIETINAGIKSINRDFNGISKTVHRPSFMKNVGKGDKEVKSALSGTSWVWNSATEGATTTNPKNDSFVISFTEKNRVSSKTDCNTLMGSYTLNGSSLMFGPLAMTMMFCEGSQETVYASLLGKVTQYSVEGTTLTLTIPTGKMVFTKK